uniref:Valine--tRNA ligase n=1 Tax=Panagrolaimus sp. JU765 TaxID=591449 RepID=A0AC34Q6A6_9BILA
MPLVFHRSCSSFSAQRVVNYYKSLDSNIVLSKAEGNNEKTFRMVLPPPNVTGNLHIGHAVTVVMEDSICRYQKRNGVNVEWIPGFDHAGIATQTVVERKLFREKGLLRSQINHDEFLQYCQSWSNERQKTIKKQLNEMGASLNWNKAYYTMDENFSSAVRHAFCRLFDEKLIFRDKRMVNWCPTLQSTISDQEVDFIRLEGPTCVSPSKDGEKPVIDVGKLHVVLYKLDDCDEYVKVATTRPETLFADMALAVNPNDPKNSGYIGKWVIHPLTGERLPIIADELVDINKGTGVLKITPAHDFLDYRIAKKHPDIFGSEYRVCIGEDGKLVNAGAFSGLDRLQAKSKILMFLRDQRLYSRFLEQKETHLPVCSRTGDFIEPSLKEQWFLDCSGMNKNIIEFITRNEIHVYPEGNKQKLIDWLSYPEPWCLSRQLDWGHRIPVYLKNHNWIASETHLENCPQDSDVLDTWFSSALIPLIVRGWPSKSVTSIPLNLMETGHDIIGFWVARMLTLCSHLGGSLPFNKVLLHGLVRDSAGRKMSKSLGNVIDPLDVINGISLQEMIARLKESSLDAAEISKAESDLVQDFPEGMKAVGSDALRFALLRHDLLSEGINVSVHDLSQEGFRFCNKLWNLSKYCKIVFDAAEPIENEYSTHPVDLWITTRLKKMMSQLRLLMDFENDGAAAAPHLAFTAVRDFILTDLCDVYLETTKKTVNNKNENDEDTRLQEVSNTLFLVSKLVVATLEPFMPLIANYIGHSLPGKSFRDLNLNEIINDLPENERIETKMDLTMAIVNAIRSTRSTLEIPKRIKLLASIDTSKGMQPLTDVLSDFVNVELTGHHNDNWILVPIPGHTVNFYIQIEESKRQEVIEKFTILLEKAESKVKQKKTWFENSQETLQKLKSSQKTKNNLERAEKKNQQTKMAYQSAVLEAEKLRNMLEVIQRADKASS